MLQDSWSAIRKTFGFDDAPKALPQKESPNEIAESEKALSSEGKEEKVEQESADLASSKSKKDPCNIGKGVCYDEQFGPEVPQGNKVKIDSNEFAKAKKLNDNIAMESKRSFTQIAGQAALSVWEFAAENPKTADILLTTGSVGKKVIPAAAGGCVAGAMSPVPGGCAAGAAAAGGAVFKSAVKKEILTHGISGITDQVLPVDKFEKIVSNVLAIQANLILKASPELTFKEAYALGATISLGAVDKAFGYIGRKEVVSNFQKFMAKGEGIVRVRGQYAKTILRDSYQETFSTERYIKDAIIEVGKQNAKN